MGSLRDERRAAVYAAEQQLRDLLERAAQFGSVDFFGSNLLLPVERRFDSLEQVAAYFGDVLAASAWSAVRAPKLRERRGAAAAHYEFERACIALPVTGGEWAWRETVLLHELAHHIVGETSADAAAHGSEFVGVFVALIEQQLGESAALILRAAFDGVGVEVGRLQ